MQPKKELMGIKDSLSEIINCGRQIFVPRFGLLQIPELKAENAAYYAHNGVY